MFENVSDFGAELYDFLASHKNNKRIYFLQME